MLNYQDQAEQVWNMCCGPYRTSADVLAEAESASITPQCWLHDAVLEANKQGAALDVSDAFLSLCEQCGVEAS